VTGLRAYRVPRSRVVRRFQRLTRSLTDHRPPVPCETGFILPRATRLFRAYRCRTSRASTREVLPWGFSPLRDNSWKSHRNEAGLPSPTSAPPTGFLTLSTVYSSPSLVGLFHPTATSGVRSTGVLPVPQPDRLVGVPCPPGVARPSPALRCQRAPDPIPCHLQGFPASQSVALRKRLSLRRARSPPELLPPPGTPACRCRGCLPSVLRLHA